MTAAPQMFPDIDAHAQRTGIPPIVLVVDDHTSTLAGYDALLSEQGYWVACASSGLEALDCAKDLHPDVIVTDVGLQGDMDGAELIRCLRDDTRLSKVPILVVTGRAPRELPSFAGLPMSGLLLKPVAADTLVNRVALALSRPEQDRATAATTPTTAPTTSPATGISA